MQKHGSQWLHIFKKIEIKILKRKKKSWEPFISCQLNSTANSAHFHQNWAGFAVLFSRQILNRSQDFFLFNILIFIYLLKYETIETHGCAFFTLNILSIGTVRQFRSYSEWCLNPSWIIHEGLAKEFKALLYSYSRVFYKPCYDKHPLYAFFHAI